MWRNHGVVEFYGSQSACFSDNFECHAENVDGGFPIIFILKCFSVFVCLSVCLSVRLCQHVVAIHSVSAPPCAMDTEAGRDNQQNTGSHAAPSPGYRQLSIAVSLEKYDQLPCGGVRVTQPSSLAA